MENKYQKIGAALLLAALVLLFLESVTLCYIALAGVLGIDLYLVKKKEKTITQWYRPKFPKLVDTILTIGIVVLFAFFHNPIVVLYLLMGTINGHLNGDW